jgi:DNA primase
MLPQTFINQVKNATDILQLTKQYTELKKVGNGIWQGRCPNPEHEDSDPSFTVWEEDQSWCCYGCHHGKKDNRKKLTKLKKKPKTKIYGSDCFAFLQWITDGKMSWKESVMYLAKENGIPMPSSDEQLLYDKKKVLATSYHANLKGLPLRYLEERGLNKSDMDAWGLGFDGYKITFPLYDRYRNILGFTKRWLEMPEGSNDKYRNSANSKIFNKGCYLYGIHNLDDTFDEIRITEGPIDVILSDKYNVRNIVATLGTSFTENHAEIIKNLGKVPVFCMDGDSAGLNSIEKSIEMLSDIGVYSKLLILPQDKDMANMALEYKDNLEQYVVDNAITYGYHKIQSIINGYDSKMNELKLQLYPELVRLLNEIPGDEQYILKEFIRKYYINNNLEKLCNKCNSWLPCTKEYFYNNKLNKLDGLYPYCISCARVKAKEWAKNNYDQFRVNVRKQDINPSSKRKTILRKNTRQRLSNGKQKEWQRNNKDKIQIYNLERKLHKNHNISKEELKELYDYANYSCMYCGIPEEEAKKQYGQKLHKDHAYNNGSNGIENCILACKGCNCEKHEQDWDEWYISANPKHTEERYNKIKNRLNKFKI